MHRHKEERRPRRVEPNARRVHDHEIGFGEKLGPIGVGVFARCVFIEQVRPMHAGQDSARVIIHRSLFSRYLAFLNDTDTGGPVRLQDYKDICDAMSSTPQGIEALTNYLMGNIEGILSTIPTGEGIVTYMYWLLATKVALDSEIIKVSCDVVRSSCMIQMRIVA